MDFEKKVPEWDNVGAEPDAQLKKEGFKAGYKPPAAYFNWFFNRISEVAKELQEKAGNEIDNKPDASGGDISDTVITSAEEPTAEYPVPAAGDSTKVFLGKTRKFFSDIKNWMTGVCMLGQIVNNCVTDNAKLPLSAAQGKQLMDLYNVLNTNQKVRTVSESANLLTELYDLCSENRFTCFHVNNIRISNGYPIDSLNNGGATGIFINNEGHWGMILLFVQQTKTLYVGRISNKTIVGWREI